MSSVTKIKNIMRKASRKIRKTQDQSFLILSYPTLKDILTSLDRESLATCDQQLCFSNNITSVAVEKMCKSIVILPIALLFVTYLWNRHCILFTHFTFTTRMLHQIWIEDNQSTHVHQFCAIALRTPSVLMQACASHSGALHSGTETGFTGSGSRSAFNVVSREPHMACRL